MFTLFLIVHLQYTRNLAYELQECIPNSEVFKRGNHKTHAFKRIVKAAIERDYTDIIIINEDKAKPSILWILNAYDTFVWFPVTVENS